MTRALVYKGSPRVFNIGSGTGQSINEILSAIEDLLGAPVKRSYLPARAFDVPVNILDITMAAEFLEWKPQTSFAAGLSRTIQWLRAGQDHFSLS
jgi:UDP-glucose 4-epimerase